MEDMDPTVISTFTELQRALLRYYLDTLGESAIKGVSFHRVGWQASSGSRVLPRREYMVVEMEIAMRKPPSLHFYASLGDSLAENGVEVDHEHEFAILTDLRSDDMAYLVADARAHHASLGRLDVDSSFLLAEDSPTRKRGYTNVLLAGADFFMPFDGKSETRIASKPVRLLALIPLTAREAQIKIQQGARAVWDDFRNTGRDLLVI
jgi:hypothetical protein